MATNAQLIQNLEVCDFNENEHVVLSQCFSLKYLLSKNEIPTILDASNWDYLNHISMPKLNANVGLLIGCNYPQVLQPLEVIPSQNGGPYALKTLLEWSVIGPRVSKGPSEKNCVFFVKTKFSAVCDMCMDVCSLETTEASIKNKQFLAEVNDSIKLKKNNHYEISFPLKFSNLKPSPNRQFAYQQLMSLKRKFLKKPSFYDDYVQFVSKMLDNNYAEKATNCEESNVWFILHQGVYHPLKPEKICVVFDCSACFRSFLLNDNLLQVPYLTNSFLGVLCRFRLEPIAIMGDIQSMFHQVELPEKDRDLMRFLWWKDGDLNEPPQEYRIKVYLFGAVCSPSCADFARRKTAEDNESKYPIGVTKALFNNFYVDDCLATRANEEQAISLISQLSKLLQKGGFNITKWVSKSDRVLKTIPEADRAVKSDYLHLPTHNPDTRALGLLWSTKTDTFYFEMSNIKKTCLNRRQLFSIVNSIYALLGFLAPIILL